MAFNTETYVRIPFVVEAVRVDADNMVELADWCAGEIRTLASHNNKPEQKYIKVGVLRPMSLLQTRAFVGDWLLKAGSGFKIYSNKAFKEQFQKESEQ